MDAMEASSEPVIFSHSNARGLRDHVRNIDDEQMKALAENGGVMGICSFRIMLRPSHERPTYEDFLDHLDYAIDLIGVDHVGIGIDRVTGDEGALPEHQGPLPRAEDGPLLRDVVRGDRGGWGP